MPGGTGDIAEPGSPIPGHEKIRHISSGDKPLDANSKGPQGGPGAQMEKSRKISFMVTSQLNAAMAKLGQSINIFA